MTKPVLNLTTAARKRHTVNIDGRPYELLALEALPLAAYQSLERLSARLTQLWNATSSKEREEQLHKTFDELIRMILRAPAHVHQKLNDLQRAKIYQTFISLQTSLNLKPARRRIRPATSKA